MQITFFVALSSQISQLQAAQDSIRKEMSNNVDEVRKDNQYKISELTRELSKQKSEFKQEITLLKASSGQDFSGIIDRVIQGVVSVGTDKSAGTGFIVDSGGYVVTNSHVIDESPWVKILTYDGVTHDARVVGIDSTKDIALLKASGIFDHVELADSDKVQLGEKVIAIGNPLGLSFTVTEGIVSGMKREGPNGLKDYIQTDVTLNPGNSGGPLINAEGSVIGMNNFKFGGAEGLGFAVESNLIRDTINAFVNATLIK